MTRCRPGDMAIVIDAVNVSNIGRIVTVVRVYDGTQPLAGDGHQWLVTSPVPMLWCNPAEPASPRWERKSGPVFDWQLQPIRPGRGADGPVGVEAMDDVSQHHAIQEVA